MSSRPSARAETRLAIPVMRATRVRSTCSTPAGGGARGTALARRLAYRHRLITRRREIGTVAGLSRGRTAYRGLTFPAVRSYATAGKLINFYQSLPREA